MKVQGTPALVAPLTHPDEAATKKAAIAHAAKEFEALMLKQLLTSAQVLGKEKGGYTGMALDALATGITDGGGIGLARKLEDTVQAAEMAHKSAATKL